VGFDEKGEHLVSIGGSIDKVSISVWKVSELLDLGKSQ
jgi:hypothetical protein